MSGEAIVDHLHVRDVDYNTFYEKKLFEDDTNLLRGPLNVRNVVVPNLTDKTFVDATGRKKASNNFNTGSMKIQEIPEDKEALNVRLAENCAKEGVEPCVHKMLDDVDMISVERDRLDTVSEKNSKVEEKAFYKAGYVEKITKQMSVDRKTRNA